MTIKYLNPYYNEVNPRELTKSIRLYVSLKGGGSACSSGKCCTSLKMAEDHAKELLKKYPLMDEISIRDGRLDSNRRTGCYGRC